MTSTVCHEDLERRGGTVPRVPPLGHPTKMCQPTLIFWRSWSWSWRQSTARVTTSISSLYVAKSCRSSSEKGREQGGTHLLLDSLDMILFFFKSFLFVTKREWERLYSCLTKLTPSKRSLHFRHHIASFCSISPEKMVQSTVTASLSNTQWCFLTEWISFLNKSVESMIQWLR